VRESWQDELTRIQSALKSACENPTAQQTAFLGELLTFAGTSSFAQDHHLTPGLSIEEYRARVPVRTVDELQSYVYRAYEGEADVLFPGRPVFFARTSGTTGRPKLVAFSEQVRTTARAFVLSMLASSPEELVHSGFWMLGKYHEATSPGGVPVGGASGFVRRSASDIPCFGRFPDALAEITDTESRNYGILRLLLEKPLLHLASLNPASLIALFDQLRRCGADLAEDLRAGDVRRGPALAREALQTERLHPAPSSAEALEAWLATKDAPVSVLFPELRRVTTWSEGSMKLHLPKLAAQLPGVELRRLPLGASEGHGMTTPLSGRDVSIPSLLTAFYEFVPADEDASEHNVRLMSELEIGRDYRIVISNHRGLYRALTEDVFRVEEWEGKVPVLEFQHRHGLTSSLSGEKLTEPHASSALVAATSILRTPPRGAQLVPEWRDNAPPRYVVTLEPGGHEDEETLHAFLATVETTLRSQNPEYGAKRDSRRLGPPILATLAAGSFECKKRAMTVDQNRSDAQYKVSPLQRAILVRESLSILRELEYQAPRAPSPQTLSLTVAEALVRTISVAGVRCAFGVPGGYTSNILDALERSGMRTIRCMHEGSAAFAAAGYAQASGELGVTFAQSGPGVTNLATGVAAAFMDSVPMLVVASQASLGDYGRDGHQECRGIGRSIDQLELFRTMAHQLYRPPTAVTAMRSIRQAVSVALTERAPTVIDLAVDLSSSRIDFEDLEPHQFVVRSHPVDHDAVQQVTRMMRAARRPVLLLGDKIAHRGATADIANICEEQDVAVVCADFAKGVLPENHALFAGVLGQSGHESAAELVRESDLVIALGTRMSLQTTISFEPGLFKRLVQIEEQASEIARHYSIELGAVSDLRGFVRALRIQLGDGGIDRGARERVAALRAKHAVYDEDISRRAELNTPSALRVLRERLPRETLIAGDCGLNLQYLKRHFPIVAPDGFFNLYGLAAMGAAVPLSIGVKLARPTTPVVAIIGDGGMMVYPGELAVAAELGLNTITVVMNNRGYLQVGDRLANYFGTRNGCTMPHIDFVQLAAAMGCGARRVDERAELASAIEWALAETRPTLIEVMTEGDDLYDMTMPQTRAAQDKWFKRDPLVPPWPFDKT